MKHVMDLAKAAACKRELTTNPQNGSQELTEEAGRFINKVFSRLVAVCPAWRSAIDGNPDQWSSRYKIELVEALRESGVSRGEQIESGLAATRRRGSPFLPSPGQFAEACLGEDPEQLHGSAAYSLNHDTKKLLERPKACKEDAMKHISNLRGFLK